MRILTVVGARPEFIKSLALSKSLAAVGAEELVVHTGQHYDLGMSDVFFHELGLPEPWQRLQSGGGTHGSQTASMLVGIEAAITQALPDWVVVYGDTNSTLAGGLAAAKLHVPVAHVEAGLRSFNRRMPEEINRVLVDHLSTMLLTPTRAATENLAREGIASTLVHQVGDVNYDVTLLVARRAESRSPIAGQLGLKAGEFLLATIHRAETTDDPAQLQKVIRGLAAVSTEIPVVFPIHPRTRGAIEANVDLSDAAGLHIVDPVGFPEMIALMRDAAVIATDSGGVQKEAFFLRTPCATLRTETEWVETVELGWNRLVDLSSSHSIASGVLGAMGTTGTNAEPYGNGATADRISALLAANT